MDSTLVAKALAGSLEAFDQLMVRYQKLIFKITFNFTKETDAALDLTQDVFLKSYEKLGHLANPAQFKLWLIRIAYNECISWQRAHHIHEQLDPELFLPTEHLEQEQAMLDIEQRQNLQVLLGRLNPKHRLAIMLKYFEGLPIKEIAMVLDCSEDVVKNMLYRGVRRMARFAEI